MVSSPFGRLLLRYAFRISSLISVFGVDVLGVEVLRKVPVPVLGVDVLMKAPVPPFREERLAVSLMPARNSSGVATVHE
jgi:hypothetical protein